MLVDAVLDTWLNQEEGPAITTGTEFAIAMDFGMGAPYTAVLIGPGLYRIDWPADPRIQFIDGHVEAEL